MTSKKKIELKRRSTILLLVTILFTLVIFLRLFYFQVLRSNQIQKIATKQQEVRLKLEAKRGVIYDRNLKLLAFNLPAESFFGVPESISNKNLVAGRFSNLTSKTYEQVRSSFNQEGKKFVWLKRKCEEEEALKIKDWDLKGVYIQKETKRSYPCFPLASDLIGFVDVDNKGLAGIEYQYDQDLKGKDGEGLFQKDGWGNSYQIQNCPLVYPQSGKSLILTVDLDLQAKLEEELKNSVKLTKSEAGSGVLMNPNTGEILAMAYISKANSEGRYDNLRVKNNVVCDNFEPGSTFKIVTAAAALEKGIKKPEDRIFAEMGKYKIGKKTIHDIHEYGWLTFKECVVFSSNIGVTKVAMEVGEKNLYDYAEKLGFCEKTGIDLPGEAKGIFPAPGKWSDITLATFAIGRGFSITPLQLIRAYSAIANGGFLIKPYVVKAVLDEEGKTIQEFHPAVIRKALKSKTAYLLTDFLKGVVSEGTASTVQIEGVDIAGKTGTAEKPRVGARGYEKDKYIASFVGFFPAENPQIVGLIILDSPKGLHYGGQTAAPAFKRVTEKIIPSQNIVFDREKWKSDDKSPGVEFSYAVVSKQKPIDKVNRDKNLTRMLSEVPPYIEKSASTTQDLDLNIIEGQKLDGLVKVMPKVTGFTVREAVKLLSSHSIPFKIKGSGKVKKQIPLPGTNLMHGETCFLECKIDD
jgi:cell division protein FtsI/penicillin-binding protein 2